VFAALRDRSVADQMLVYRALRARNAALDANKTRGSGARTQDVRRRPHDHHQPPEDRTARSLAAFRACWSALGEVPSKRDYELWYADSGKAQGRPSATFLRNSFGGSWAKLVDGAGAVPAPNVLALRRTANGPAFTAEELVTLL
jgi:hypothetical protein